LGDDSPFIAVITDMISLKEEMISDGEDVLLDWIFMPEERPDTDEIGLVRFVIIHVLYSGRL
jgi:hypothetical protein